MKVGDKAWLKPTIYNRRSKTTEVEISKIGRKYIEMNDGTKFDITNNFRQASPYAPDWEVYFNHQDLLDEEETLQILDYLRKTLGNYGPVKSVTLDQLRAMKKILKGDD